MYSLEDITISNTSLSNYLTPCRVCTDRTDTEQISKGNNPVYSFINSAPNLKSICKSALVASLFLLKNRFGFGMSDMHSLTAAALGGESTEDKSLLGDVPQGKVIFIPKEKLF